MEFIHPVLGDSATLFVIYSQVSTLYSVLCEYHMGNYKLIWEISTVFFSQKNDFILSLSNHIFCCVIKLDTQLSK